MPYLRLVLSCVLLVAFASEAMAAEPVSEPPHQSLSITEGHRSLSLLSNPATAGFGAGGDVQLFTGLVEPSVTSIGGTAGGFLFDPLFVGLGAVYTKPSSGDPWGSVFHLATALAASSKVSLGLGMRLYGTEDEADGLVDLTLGLAVRPASWLSLAFALDHTTAPQYGDVTLGRVYGLGLALRPYGDLVTLSYDLFIDEDSVALSHLAKLSVRPLDGLTVFAAFEAPDLGPLQLTAGVEVTLGPSLVSSTQLVDLDSGSYHGATIGLGLFSSPPEGFVPTPGRAIKLHLVGEVVESAGQGSLTITKLVDAMRRIESDDTAKAVVIVLEGFGCSWAHATELARWVSRIEASGKKVIVHADTLSNRTYLFASQASMVLMEPGGALVIGGLQSRVTFLKGLLDTLGVTVPFYRIGKYKTAPEQLAYDTMSPELEEQVDQVLDSTWGLLVGAVATGRGLDETAAIAALDGGPYGSKAAQEKGLIDGVVTAADLTKEIPYALAPIPPTPTPVDAPWGGPKKIAVIPVTGTIVPGASPSVPLLGGAMAGSTTFARHLQAALDDSDVLGVVVRVDSGGGSSMAADKMWTALVEATKVKPVVVSFGGTAASGGYYLAAGATRIFAESSTITGSIGIFWMKVVIGGLLDKLGITTVAKGKGGGADIFDVYSAPSPEAAEKIMAILQEGYDLFLDRIVTGRTMTKDALLPLATGKLFSGQQAVDHGLVDEVGGLLDAVTYLLAPYPSHVTRTAVVIEMRDKGLIELLQGMLPFGLSTTPGAIEDALDLSGLTGLAESKTFSMLPMTIDIE